MASLAELDKQAISSRVERRVRDDPYANALTARGAPTNLTLDLRYTGQGYEISVPLGSHTEAYEPTRIQAAFEREYTRVFGMTFPGYEVEVFNWTIEVTQPGKGYALGNAEYAASGLGDVRLRGERHSSAGQADGTVPLSVINRYALRPGERVAGNTLIEENDATIYLPAFVQATVLPSLDILAEIDELART